ncbi:MobA/MobL family protein [Devosia salina]|uniref:MobA/MobL family protein n=1 Tax=Devosia salina TaxID=2860336 RepID=A0ABX8WKN1_9HYPH|nr:MobA/MobL family protein [Devosia salina]QYO78903.1 MobA/MobL family protein [Devosia salina]
MPLQRSRGHSSVQRLAYITRRRLLSARTGQVFDHADRPDLVAALTLVPKGCAEMDAVDLWEAIEAASKRADAALGFELVLSLPMPAELPLEHSCRLAQAFAHEIIVERHQLAATLAVHRPHAGQGEDAALEDALGPDDDSFGRSIATASANLHCHILVAPRQLTPDGLARRRYTALDPVTRSGRTYGRHWGKLWGDFQNRFFAAEGLDLRVTPNPPVTLDPAPLRAVRRWRQRARRTTPQINGRALLVNPAREDENAAIALSIDDALACFEAPFTRGELEAFFSRHLHPELSAEMTQACIGLGQCVALDVEGSEIAWFASVNLVQTELAAFGRSLMLAARASCSRQVAPHIGEGFSDETRTVLAALFEDADLSLIEATGAAGLLVADISGTAQAAGLAPVVIAHAAGHPPPRAVVRDIEALRTRMVSQATIIIDDADALTARDLSLALLAAIAGNSKIVLIRRIDSDWPRLPLLDLVAHHVRVLRWSDRFVGTVPAAGPAPAPAPPGAAPPRSAIAHAPSGRNHAPIPPNWPRFALDAEGGLVTAPAAIAGMIRFFATSPGDLDWTVPERDASRDEAGLAQRLDQWRYSQREPGWDDWANIDALDADLAAEAAAFATLAGDGLHDRPEDDPDMEPPTPDDVDFADDGELDWDGVDFEDPREPE